MKKIAFVLIMALVLSVGLWAEKTECAKKAEEEIKKVIVDAYVNGIHINGDIEAIKKGFHPDFAMLIPKKEKNGFDKISIQTWIGWIEGGKKKNPNRPKPNVTYKFPIVNATGDAGVAKIEIYKDGKHIYSDYFALYKFSDGWKIVNKIYFSHKKK